MCIKDYASPCAALPDGLASDVTIPRGRRFEPSWSGTVKFSVLGQTPCSVLSPVNPYTRNGRTIIRRVFLHYFSMDSELANLTLQANFVPFRSKNSNFLPRRRKRRKEFEWQNSSPPYNYYSSDSFSGAIS